MARGGRWAIAVAALLAAGPVRAQQPPAQPPPPVPQATPPPPPAQPPPAAAQAAPPPPGGGSGDDAGVTARRHERSPLATVALDAGYGGIAGLLVGGGVTLVQQGDHWGRDLSVGAGIGLIVGAAVGVAHAVWETGRDDRGPPAASAALPPRARLADDGLNRTDRDPVITATTVGLSVHF